MERFKIVATEQYGADSFIAAEIEDKEIAIEEATRIFKEGSMQKVRVMDDNSNVVFKQIRRCKCMNVQQELVAGGEGRIYRCMDCGIVINHRGYLR